MRKYLILHFYIFLSVLCFSQKQETSVQLVHGFSTANMTAKHGKFEHSKLNFAQMNSINLKHKYSLFPDKKVFVEGYFDFNNMLHYHNIYNDKNIFKLALFEQVSVKSNFISFGVGITKEFHVIEDKFIVEFQTRLMYNLESNKWTQYNSDSVYTQNQHYKFDLNAAPNNNRRVSFDAGLDLKFCLIESLFLNVGLRIQRMFFNSEFNFYSGIVNLNGEPQPYSTIQNGYKDGNGNVKHTIIAPKIGLSYKF